MDNLLNLAFAIAMFTAHAAVVVRVVTRPNRAPASRIAWIVVVVVVPLVGMVAYLLLGEASVGRAHIRRVRQAEKALPALDETICEPQGLPPQAAALFDLGRSINGFREASGNRITLLGDAEASPDEPMRDSRAAVAALLRDIDAAEHHIHVVVYIWLEDNAGRLIATAIANAAQRGVQCRVMVDALGSRNFARSVTWKRLRAAGVRVHTTLSDVSRLLHVTFSRVDLRDHRKMVVIDNRVAYCGSQNFADPEFRVKARQAPWVDLMLRCEGPIVQQMQSLFLRGWIPETGEEQLEHLPAHVPAQCFESGCVAQAFESGPTSRPNAMSDMFVACIYAARAELVITTPYFVPDESILRALCAAPRRGVRTTIIFPARNDSWLVANACRSTYFDLLNNGVEVYEYPLGLLHTKSMTIDGELALVGSANMDRRSLELNYENSLLIADCVTAAAVRHRQLVYLSVSRRVSLEAVQAWPFHARLVQNVVGMMSPVL